MTSFDRLMQKSQPRRRLGFILAGRAIGDDAAAAEPLRR